MRTDASIFHAFLHTTILTTNALQLLQETLKPDGADTMTKDEIRETALEELDVDMYSEVRGFTKWSGIKSLEAKKWVKRDA